MLVFFLIVWIIYNIKEINSVNKYLKIFTKNKDFLCDSELAFNSLSEKLLFLKSFFFPQEINKLL